MNKKRFIAILIIAAVVFAAAIGGAVAYMIKISDDKKTEFEPAQVSCVLNEKFENNEKSQITVENTSNIDVFVRVRLVTYWVDDNGNVVSKAPAEINFTLNDSWVKDANSDTYYYRLPIAPDSTTAPLSNESLTLQSKDGYKQVIDVFAEVIQANPKEAVKDSWGVNVSNGQITQ